jgi:hypothetical protein
MVLKPEHARVLRNLSKQWMKLANDLERAQRFLNDSHVESRRPRGP